VKDIGTLQVELTKELAKRTSDYMSMPLYMKIGDTYEPVDDIEAKALVGYICGLAWALNKSMGVED